VYPKIGLKPILLNFSQIYHIFMTKIFLLLLGDTPALIAMYEKIMSAGVFPNSKTYILVMNME